MNFAITALQYRKYTSSVVRSLLVYFREIKSLKKIKNSNDVEKDIR